jgi:aspartate kinase
MAAKRDITVVDITSDRMLMAYGFLRRVFEVFERFQTAVDVVTTSEVSVSVTVDDRRHLDAIVEQLSQFAEVGVEPEMALLCAVGDRLRAEPATAARVVGVLEEVPLRMISQAASRRNITVIMRQADLPHAMHRLHEEFFA